MILKFIVKKTDVSLQTEFKRFLELHTSRLLRTV